MSFLKSIEYNKKEKTDCLFCDKRKNILKIQLEDVYGFYQICPECLYLSLKSQVEKRYNRQVQCVGCFCACTDYCMFLGFWRVCDECSLGIVERILSYMEKHYD